MTNAQPIKVMMYCLGIDQGDIAKTAGVSRSYVSQVITGRKPCSDKLLTAFKEKGIANARDYLQ